MFLSRVLCFCSEGCLNLVIGEAIMSFFSSEGALNLVFFVVQVRCWCSRGILQVCDFVWSSRERFDAAAITYLGGAPGVPAFPPPCFAFPAFLEFVFVPSWRFWNLSSSPQFIFELVSFHWLMGSFSRCLCGLLDPALCSQAWR